ncbi:MAG: cupin domain-containing protein [Gammaproteobacteria bacterium]|nr:cupin domain-containing protein [Gammaproteobacteria bacterium]
MTRLRIFAEDAPEQPLATHTEAEAVAAGLAPLGVRFERWPTHADIRAGDDQDKVLRAYEAEITRLMQASGYQSADVVSMHPEHPDKAAMRGKFLAEHAHAEDEVRFFVDGAGLFTLHADGKVYEVLCERGDLIGVPAGTRHWFDMGPNPSFVAVRIFTSPDGWAAEFTGSDIASRFPRLEN